MTGALINLGKLLKKHARKKMVFLSFITKGI